MNINSLIFAMKLINSMINGNNLLFLDIDNTLLVPQNIYIYYEKDDLKLKLTPEEYAKLDVTRDQKKYYNYTDFRDVNAVRNSIRTSLPLKHNLEVIDEYVKNNWQLGILTARGQERLISRITPRWISNNLKNKFPKIKREDIHAVNDEYKMYNGYNDPEKKLLVLKKYVESGKYDNIAFIDDNIFTLKLIEKYNKTLKKNKRIILIQAQY